MKSISTVRIIRVCEVNYFTDASLEILGLPRAASKAEIKKAYHKVSSISVDTWTRS